MQDYTVHQIPVVEIGIDEDLNDARGKIIAMDVADLARDIEKSGLQQPLHVQLSNRIPGKKYRCVAGNRRLTALRVIKKEFAPCFFVDPSLNELSVRAINLKENLLRKDLDVVQEAIAIRPFVTSHWTEEEIAKEFSQSRGWVQIRKIVLGLPKDMQEELKAGLLTQAQIRRLGAFVDQKKQWEYLRKIKDHSLRGEKLKEKPPVRVIAPEARKERKPEEIFAMIEYLLGITGKSGLTTRALAWAAGSISDLEFAGTVREYCAEEGIDYEPHDAVAHLVG